MSILYPDLGSICHAPGCECYDMLAAKCSLCQATTCTEHAKPDLHNCAALRPTNALCVECGEVVTIASQREETQILAAHRATSCTAVPRTERPTCSAPSCDTKEPFFVECLDCRQQVCLAHRHADMHGCVTHIVATTLPAIASGPMTPTEAALPFHRWQYSNSPESVDFNNIETDLRVGLRVFFDPSLLVRPCYVCVNRKWSIGRTLDAACHSALLPNPNSRTQDPQARLKVYLLWGRCEVLPMVSTIGELMEQRTGFRGGCGVYVTAENTVPYGVVFSLPRWVVSLQLQSLAGKGLQAQVTKKTWLERMDEGPSVFTKALRAVKTVPIEQAAIAGYIMMLCAIGWFDLS